MTDLTTVLEAARKWADELTNYIEPDARKQGNDEQAEGYESEADKVYAAIKALEEGVEPPTPSPVSYDPCIQGTVEIEGRKSEFLFLLDRADVGFSQWGADNTVLWARVELLDEMSKAAKEWALDNLNREEDSDD